jgi:hypothetical protein
MSRSLLALLFLWLPASAAADPLDRVTGTEGWKVRVPENIKLEWRDWYRARVGWRKAARDLRVQRTRSLRLAALLARRGGGPDPAVVRRLLKSRAVGAGSPGEARLPWVKVPVERLDSSGQAIDDEGDKELKRVFKRRRR